MKPVDIVKSLRDQKLKAIESVTDQVAERLIKAALVEIRTAIEAQQDGALGVMGLGRFHVKQVEKEADGSKKMIRRISFRAAEPKTPDANKVKTKGKKSAA